MIAAWIVAAATLVMPAQAPDAAPEPEIVASVQIHGNNATPDADVLAIAGVAAGDPFTPTLLADVHQRLLASRRFEDVTVLKRYASIADPSRIALVILVDERPVRVEAARTPGGPPRVVRRGWLRNLMVLPILSAEDGYGVTYGARLAYVDPIGRGSRLSFPLSWGGSKQAGAELERTFRKGPITRVQAGASLDRTRNPAFEVDDSRRRTWMRAERAFGPLRVGGQVDWARVSFDGAIDHLRSAGADVTVDTRVDPVLPRNAVFARAFWTRTTIDGEAVDRRSVDARGYLGLVGQTVLVGRAAFDAASGPLPPYLQTLLGGWSSLRGYRAGAFVGETVASGSLELRVPLTSPLHVARTGVSVFVDAGAACRDGERIADRPAHVGVGAGVWATATVLRFGVSVARGIGDGTRVNFEIGVLSSRF
jgi:outer membrane protein assembly factor BamA